MVARSVADSLAVLESVSALDDVLDAFPNGLPNGPDGKPLQARDYVLERRAVLTSNAKRPFSRSGALPRGYRSPVH